MCNMRYVQSFAHQQSAEECTVVKVYILNQKRVSFFLDEKHQHPTFSVAVRLSLARILRQVQ